ncbi:hypothetical protein BOX15_Mlig018539g1, partial [Macrostomum lignano]
AGLTMVKRKNIIPNAHFHKDWQRFVRTWFNQPARKERRRKARVEKARLVAPRPVNGPLRPVVRCQTIRYNMRVRPGRGFSLDELKAAGINRRVAQTIGIAVDHRRKNRSAESLQRNAQRLKAYRGKLILFPKNPKAPKAGEASEEELRSVVQRPLPPVVAPGRRLRRVKARVQSEDDKKFHAFHAIRQARANKRLDGLRKKKAEQAEKEKK